MDRWIDRQIDGQMDRQIDGQMDRWQIDRWIGGWMDGWIDGQMDMSGIRGWIDLVHEDGQVWYKRMDIHHSKVFRSVHIKPSKNSELP